MAISRIHRSGKRLAIEKTKCGGIGRIGAPISHAAGGGARRAHATASLPIHMHDRCGGRARRGTRQASNATDNSESRLDGAHDAGGTQQGR